MTGIERLREFVAGVSPFTAVCGVTRSTYDEEHTEVLGVRLRDFLSEIADQIELDASADIAPYDYRLVKRTQAIRSVLRDMERHVSGVESMEDSPVARWARELRRALTKNEVEKMKYGFADVSMSAYDLLPPEDREAISWMRRHGGIEVLRRMFQDADSRRVELCGALGIDLDTGWSEAMAAMRLRLVPEGMDWLVESWPRFEDNAPLKFGDMALIEGYPDMVEAVQLWIHGRPVIYGDGGSQQLERGERVKRPAPKVLDADGAEIREGDTVWHVETGEQCKVVEVDSRSVSVDFRVDGDGTKHTGSILPPNLTHRAPVLAADGRPLREGEHVYHVETGAELVVKELPKPGEYQAVVVFAPPASHLTSFDPDQLTPRAP